MIPVAEPVIGERELECVSDAVRSGWVSSLGEYVSRFETNLGSVVGTRHVLSVCNGTAALHLALVASGVQAGDEVIVPSMTFVATANAVRYAGATPIFADCDPENWCLSASAVEEALTTRTRAVIAVHLFGHPADIDAIKAVVAGRDIVVIEDAAEALGAMYRDRPAGSLADAGVFSFYGNKLITTGEGGALSTNNSQLADKAASLRDHAMDPHRRYWHDEVGFNYRLTNIQAALGVAQLERLDTFLARKRELAERYAEGFRELPCLELQLESPWAKSSCWMTTVLVGEDLAVSRDTLAQLLLEQGIDSRPTFVPLHQLPPYSTGQDLPVSQRVGQLGLTLPSGASLKDEDQRLVIDAVLRACR